MSKEQQHFKVTLETTLEASQTLETLPLDKLISQVEAPGCHNHEEHILSLN